MKDVACICAKELKENIHLVDGTGWDKCRNDSASRLMKFLKINLFLLNKISIFVNISSLLLHMIIKNDEYNGCS